MTGVLMVCEGNVCRSPVARAILERALPAVSVSSAGTRASLAGTRIHSRFRLHASTAWTSVVM
nr:hypothetical protein [Paraburkholderia sp. BL25I1N1]